VTGPRGSRGRAATVGRELRGLGFAPKSPQYIRWCPVTYKGTSGRVSFVIITCFVSLIVVHISSMFWSSSKTAVAA